MWPVAFVINLSIHSIRVSSEQYKNFIDLFFIELLINVNGVFSCDKKKIRVNQRTNEKNKINYGESNKDKLEFARLFSDIR